MSRFLSPEARRLDPYTPGEQLRDKKYVKLNTNECPYPPSPKVMEAIRAAGGEGLRLYPDPECLDLRTAIAQREGLDVNQVFCGNGSDEILAFAFQAFFDPDREVVFPRITYSFYPVYTSFFGLRRREVPMEPDFSSPIDLLCGNNGGVVLANPNAPTGLAVGLDTVEKLLNANPDVVVLVDEAYIDFGGDSAVGLIGRYPNLLVVQTASKSRALAGLRVGWAMGDPGLIDGLRCVRDSINSYTVDRLAQAGAAAALRDEDYFQSIRRRVIDTREWTERTLREKGFTVLPSQANFLFVSHPGRTGKELLDGLRRRGVLIRDCSNYHGLGRGWYRTAVRGREDNGRLIAALTEVWKEGTP